MRRNTQQRTRQLFSIILALLFMQFMALSHANEHHLTTSEINCITHLETEQFSNLLAVKAIEIVDNRKDVKQDLQNTYFAIYQLTHNYLSRAPPVFFQ